MMTTDVGLYLHIPFCLRKCNYCDFCSVGGASEEYIDSYIDRLTEELLTYKNAEKIAVSTVYFGGGTPSLLDARRLGKILDTSHEVFDIPGDAEITLEVNPGTVSTEKLLAYKSLGVNRLSIGLQSIHENEQKTLGRIHNFADFKAVYHSARRAGFSNIGVDLMYGIPHQTVKSFKETLDTVVGLSPEHISAYGLIVEEGTPFYSYRDKLPLPDADTECDMYSMCVSTLGSAGYLHYEISNYAKAGYESKHNLTYWRDNEYIGVGAAAYSYFDGVRFGNSRNMDEYLSDFYTKYRYTEIIDKDSERYEYAMLRLRLAEGFSISEYEDRFGISFTEGKTDILDRLAEGGYLTLGDGRIALTDRGMYVSNSVLTQIL